MCALFYTLEDRIQPDSTFVSFCYQQFCDKVNLQFKILHKRNVWRRMEEWRYISTQSTSSLLAPVTLLLAPIQLEIMLRPCKMGRQRAGCDSSRLKIWNWFSPLQHTDLQDQQFAGSFGLLYSSWEKLWRWRLIRVSGGIFLAGENRNTAEKKLNTNPT